MKTMVARNQVEGMSILINQSPAQQQDIQVRLGQSRPLGAQTFWLSLRSFWFQKLQRLPDLLKLLEVIESPTFQYLKISLKTGHPAGWPVSANSIPIGISVVFQIME